MLAGKIKHRFEIFCALDLTEAQRGLVQLVKNISIAHVSFPSTPFSAVYFSSLECFGCHSREAVPLKRQILDVAPKDPPPPPLFFLFTLSIPVFHSFVFPFSQPLSLSSSFPQTVLLLQAFCPAQAFQVLLPSSRVSPPFQLYHPS